MDVLLLFNFIVLSWFFITFIVCGIDILYFYYMIVSNSINLYILLEAYETIYIIERSIIISIKIKLLKKQIWKNKQENR